MMLHVLLMSAAAPLLGLYTRKGRTSDERSPRSLFVRGALQLGLLLLWHIPTVMSAAMHQPVLALLMHLSLFLVAWAFWDELYLTMVGHPWRAIAALIVSAKLFCLLAALLVFAPRPILHAAPAMAEASAHLNDQHLAGLVMLAVCPLSYVAMAIWIAADWLHGITRQASSPLQTTREQ